MPIFDHKEIGRVLFIHIPKTAGSSVEKWLQDSGHYCHKVHHTLPMSHQHATKDIYSKWGHFDYKFAIVRDPLTRFISALAYRSVLPNEQADVTARDALHRHLAGELDAGWGNHLTPQVNFVDDETEVFKFEEDFYRKIRRKLKIYVPFPYSNKSPTGLTAAHLSEETKQKIKEVYAEDYERFGYGVH